MQTNKFIECGCCDHFHRADFWGDCRDDNERFTLDDLESRGVDLNNDITYIEDVEVPA